MTNQTPRKQKVHINIILIDVRSNKQKLEDLTDPTLIARFEESMAELQGYPLGYEEPAR